MNDRSGFTLVELSIVLVIIGLIVGGILVGQDMIKGAEIRSTISQLSTYTSAMNTFRDKYRYLPGDIAASAAAQYGMTARAGTTGRGDGNGLLEGGAAATSVLNSETVLFWVDLNSAGLMNGQFISGTDAAAATLTGATLGNYLPMSKLGRGNYITVFGAAGTNYYQITGISATDAAGAPTIVKAMSPLEAYNMDSKLDDGMPLTGNTIATTGTTAFNTAATAAVAASGVCVENANSTYNTGTNTTTSPWATTPSCGIRVRF